MSTITLNKKQLNRSLVRIVLPIAIQDLITSSLSLVDNMMIGRVGEVAMASVGAGSQLFSILWGVLFGFSSACSAYMSQFWGVQDLKNIRKTIGFCILVCCSIGTFFAICCWLFPEKIVSLFTNIPEAIPDAATYLRIIAPTFILFPVSMALTVGLRSIQQTMLPLIIGIVTFVSNTIINYICIFGKLGLPAMGVAGAAIGTLAARIIEITLLILMVFVRKSTLRGPLKEFTSFNKVLMKSIIQKGTPVIINESFWSIGMAVMCAFFGRLTAAEYSCYMAANTIQMMFMLVAFAMADAVMILVGQKLGQGELDEAYEMARYFNNIGTYIGLISSVLMIIFSPAIVSLYNFEPETARATVLTLYVHAGFMTVELRGALIIIGALRCGGDTKFAMICELGTLWGLTITAVGAGVFLLHWPIYWIVALSAIGWIAKLFIAQKRFKTRIWCNNLVKDL